jgi:hypothetical protein
VFPKIRRTLEKFNMQKTQARHPAGLNVNYPTRNARSSRTNKMETQSRLLPSAARRRSLRSGFVPAVSPLHFTFPPAEPPTEAEIKIKCYLATRAEAHYHS